MKYSAIIIDDEIKAIQGLKVLLEHIQLPIQIIDTADNVMDGLRIFNQKKPDIVLLDIEMPNINGFDFLDLADKGNNYFIFISAHEEYALRAIKKDIDDYLLKPIAPADLRICLEKAIKYLNAKKDTPHLSDQKISIPTSKGNVFENISDIIYIKAQARYSEIVFNHGSVYLVCHGIGEYERDLANHNFFRIHKSFLVNCRYVTGIVQSDGGFIKLSNGEQIEVSKRKKAEFIKHMKL